MDDPRVLAARSGKEGAVGRTEARARSVGSQAMSQPTTTKLSQGSEGMCREKVPDARNLRGGWTLHAESQSVDDDLHIHSTSSCACCKNVYYRSRNPTGVVPQGVLKRAQVFAGLGAPTAKRLKARPAVLFCRPICRLWPPAVAYDWYVGRSQIAGRQQDHRLQS